MFSSNHDYRHSLAGIAARLVMFLAMMALMRFTADQVKYLSCGQGIIDLHFAPLPTYTAAALSSLTPKAAWFYRWGFFSVDMVYILSYCTFYRCAIRYLLQKCPVSTALSEKLMFLPVIGGTADMLENTTLFMMLGSGDYPAITCTMFMIFNIIKFVCVYASLKVVVISSLYLLKRRFSSLVTRP